MQTVKARMFNSKIAMCDVAFSNVSHGRLLDSSECLNATDETIRVFARPHRPRWSRSTRSNKQASNRTEAFTSLISPGHFTLQRICKHSPFVTSHAAVVFRPERTSPLVSCTLWPAD